MFNNLEDVQIHFKMSKTFICKTNDKQKRLKLLNFYMMTKRLMLFTENFALISPTFWKVSLRSLIYFR
jgi:hypothetical protein